MFDGEFFTMCYVTVWLIFMLHYIYRSLLRCKFNVWHFLCYIWSRSSSRFTIQEAQSLLSNRLASCQVHRRWRHLLPEFSNRSSRRYFLQQGNSSRVGENQRRPLTSEWRSGWSTGHWIQSSDTWRPGRLVSQKGDSGRIRIFQQMKDPFISKHLQRRKRLFGNDLQWVSLKFKPFLLAC